MMVYIEPNLGAGVYRINNLTNGKFYIGQSLNISKRLKSQFNALYTGKHTIPDFQSDFNAGHRFSYEILCKAPSGTKLYQRRYCVTWEYENLMNSDRSKLYNIDFTPPYIWNTIISIPDAYRFNDIYQPGDVYKPEFKKYLIHA